MGKKKLRAKYTSKGERASMSKSLSNAVARDVSEVQKHLNKQAAYNAGKKVWITIENPNPNETNKRFIRVLASSLYGDPKTRKYVMPGTGEQKKKKK